MKKLIIFDLDGTLAESKSAVDSEMAALLQELMALLHVAIISGGAWPQFEKQVLAKINKDAQFNNLSILPTCGTRYYTFHHGSWKQLYAENFSDTESALIKKELSAAVANAGFDVKRIWGEQIEDRGSQITFSALGQEAPLAAKKSWDPDFSKRAKVKAQLDKTLKGFSVVMGGSTSIDITKKGIDKAYGIRKLTEVLHIEIAEMLFIGDALFEGGNDHPARSTGVTCIQVRDPDETKRVIEAIIACRQA